jgi:hypothetical protein
VLAILVVLVILVVSGVLPPKSSTGSSGTAGGGSGELAENVDWNSVVDRIQASFGTSMISGGAQGDTLQIKVVDGFGTSGVELFCPQIRKILTSAGAPATTKVEIHDSKTLLTRCAK